MNPEVKLLPEVIFKIGIVEIRDTVVITWIILIIICLISLYIRKTLSLFHPKPLQLILEALVEGAEKLSQEVFKGNPWLIIPFLVTLWLFIGICNIVGMIPGFFPPTSDLNTPLAFALSAFLMRHYLGIKISGFVRYITHFTKPFFIFFPLHLLAELTRSLALGLRLFGNILSGEIIALIILGIVGLLLPIPFVLLHLVLGLLQAYIFGVLSLAFLSQTIEE